MERKIKPSSFLVTLDVTLLVPPIDGAGQIAHRAPHRLLDATALIDSGCTDNLISSRLTDNNPIPVRSIDNPRYPTLADGTKSTVRVDQETCVIKMRIRDHEEQITFRIVPLPDFDIFLGAPWLSLHNPTINWTEARISFPSTYCSEGCLSGKQLSGPPSSVQPQILKSCVAPLRFPSKNPDRSTARGRQAQVAKEDVVKEIIALCASLLDSTSNPVATTVPLDSSDSSPGSSDTITMPLSSTCCDAAQPPSSVSPVAASSPTNSDTGSASTNIGPYTLGHPTTQDPDDDSDMTALQYINYLAETVEEPELFFDAISEELDEPLFNSYVDPAYPPDPPDKEVLKAQVPVEFHDYLDVFSKTLASKLPQHKPWDIKIDLKPDASLPPRSKRIAKQFAN